MKLIVMIPAYNEEQSIWKVIKEIPRKIKGITKVEVLVINDGSTDRTVNEARKAGAEHIITNIKNRGLAQTFKRGMNHALELGADLIVNTDADFQYNQQEIPKLVQPLIDGNAEVVLTDRRVLQLPHMPFGKKYGNMIATWVTQLISGYPVKDAQSGFRAFSREAALRMNILSDYTYVQETIIQAVDKQLKIVQIPCEFRKREGKSRLISNIWNYAKRAGSMMLRSYVRYKPLKVFLTLGTLLFIPGFLLGLRYLYYYLLGQSGGHLQSLILAMLLMIVGFQVMILALIADTVDAGRRVQEDTLHYLRCKKLKYN